jgi:3-oxoacyl-[acyl-carrier protein] reductase
MWTRKTTSVRLKKPLQRCEMKLVGEIALVTGGSRGIGKACALGLAKEGAEVLVNYVSHAEAAEQVCHEITQSGGRAFPLKFDVSDPQAIDQSVEAVLKEKKRIGVLVNNAGITRDGLMLRYSVEDWDRVVDTNLRGAFLVSQAVLRPMMKERKGSIVHVSSISGLMGNPGQAAYCAAKAGLIGLTKSMAKELASRNIRVNAVAPGYIETDMTEGLTGDQKEAFLKTIPLGRVGTPDEIAHAVVYLASPVSNYVTGQVIVVDGGLAM